MKWIHVIKVKKKQIIAKPTLEGLIFTSINLVSLTRRMLREIMRYVCLRTITQDVLEALFRNLVSFSLLEMHTYLLFNFLFCAEVSGPSLLKPRC